MFERLQHSTPTCLRFCVLRGTITAAIVSDLSLESFSPPLCLLLTGNLEKLVFRASPEGVGKGCGGAAFWVRVYSQRWIRWSYSGIRQCYDVRYLYDDDEPGSNRGHVFPPTGTKLVAYKTFTRTMKDLKACADAEAVDVEPLQKARDARYITAVRLCQCRTTACSGPAHATLAPLNEVSRG